MYMRNAYETAPASRVLLPHGYSLCFRQCDSPAFVPQLAKAQLCQDGTWENCTVSSPCVYLVGAQKTRLKFGSRSLTSTFRVYDGSGTLVLLFAVVSFNVCICMHGVGISGYCSVIRAALCAFCKTPNLILQGGKLSSCDLQSILSSVWVTPAAAMVGSVPLLVRRGTGLLPCLPGELLLHIQSFGLTRKEIVAFAAACFGRSHGGFPAALPRHIRDSAGCSRTWHWERFRNLYTKVAAGGSRRIHFETKGRPRRSGEVEWHTHSVLDVHQTHGATTGATLRIAFPFDGHSGCHHITIEHLNGQLKVDVTYTRMGHMWMHMRDVYCMPAGSNVWMHTRNTHSSHVNAETEELLAIVTSYDTNHVENFIYGRDYHTVVDQQYAAAMDWHVLDSSIGHCKKDTVLLDTCLAGVVLQCMPGEFSALTEMCFRGGVPSKPDACGTVTARLVKLASGIASARLGECAAPGSGRFGVQPLTTADTSSSSNVAADVIHGADGFAHSVVVETVDIGGLQHCAIATF